MKKLKISLVLISAFVSLFSCQQELESISLKSNSRTQPINPGIDQKIPKPKDQDDILPPPPEVITEEFPQAIGWRIEWDDPKWEKNGKYQRFFSTIDGSLYSMGSLNSSDEATTAKVDFDLLFGFVRSLEVFPEIVHQNHIRETRLKPSDLTVEDLIDITENDPSQFATLYETSPFEAQDFQPYNYEAEGGDLVIYSPGEIFLFKTDRFPVKYGAVRIVEASNIVQGTSPRVIEVIVQKDAIGGFQQK